MQFKKLAAMAGTAIMAGMSIAAPVLGAGVTQLDKISDLVTVSDSTVSFPMFVVGANAQTADVAGAVNIAVKLASNAKTTGTVSVAGTTTETVTGGVKIRTPGNEYTPYTNIGSVKSIITSSDTDILDAGSYSTTTGGTYEYKQYLYLGGESGDTGYSASGMRVTFERPTTEDTPRIGLKITGNTIAYKYKMTFSTPVVLTSATSTATLQTLIQGTTVTLLGKDFVISDCTWSSTADPIGDFTLIGGKNVITVKSGDETTVDSEGTEYVVHLDAVTSETVGTNTYYAAVGDVNGETFELRSGQTKTLSDGTTIAASKVLLGKTGEPDFAKIAIGADKIKITNAGTVTKGTKTVSELTSDIGASTTAGWSSLSIIYTPNLDTNLKEGEALPDKFASLFDIKFNSLSPEFDDETNRQTISFSPSSYNMMLTYKNAAGEEKQMYALYYDSGTWRWMSAAVSATNQDNGYRDVIFDESQNISAIENDYFVIQKSGFSHVLQFTSFTPATSELIFTDEAGNSITSSNDTTTGGTLIVDGNSFIYNLTDAITDSTAAKKLIAVDLNGDGYLAGYTTAGKVYSPTAGAEYSYLVPKLITTGQGGIYFYKGNQSVAITSGAWAYPEIGLGGIRLSNDSSGNVVVSTYSGSGVWSDATANSTTVAKNTTPGAAYQSASYTYNYIDFTVNCINQTTTYNCNVGLGTANTSAAFQVSSTAAALKKGFVLVEEALQGSTTHNWILMPVAYDSTNTRVYINTPASDSSDYDSSAAILGTSTQYKSVTKYGSLVEYLSSTLGGSATISYPDSFTYANIYVMTPEGEITIGGTEGGTVETETVLPVTADVVKLDSEISDSDKSNYDFILVGGPCVNTLVADLATAGTFDYACDAWPGENFGLIKLVEDAFASGKTALVIAGTRAADTDLAARVVQDGSKLPAAASAKVTGESFASVVVA